jgi:hypothetical protein
MNNNDYAAEGMCHECYFDSTMDAEENITEFGEIDNENFDDVVEEIMSVLYSGDDCE